MSSKILQSESLSGKIVIPQVINGAGILDITQTTASSEDDGFNIITVRLTDGSSMEFKIKNGSKGSTGAKGDQGIQGPKGDTGEQGPKGDTGENGADGISVTHKWSGSILEITSASGTSSVDLKGEKGDKGETGPQGERGMQGEIGPQGPKGDTGEQGPKGDTGETGVTGADGYTPIKGTDYYTEADKAEMVSAVLAALPTWTGGSY